MNVKTCASTDIKVWQDIDFKLAESYVKKLQMRIVKAWEEGRIGKVKSLQRLLVTSFYAKALAVKTVTENKGKNTAGVDKEIWSTEKQKFEAIYKLKRNGYKAMPLRRIYISKKNGKKRPLSIPTMKDRVMQTLYKFALEPIAETTADNNSYGFRAKRRPQDAIEQCYKNLNRKVSASWILEGDIKGCFDNISHEWIMKHIPMDKEILKQWLESGYIETKKLFKTEEGTPQGSPISPIISNMVLDGLEKILLEKFKIRRINGKKHSFKVNLVRFADDFIITGESKEILENEVMPIVIGFLQERGLELSKEKTLITHIDDGFDFLGCNIRKYKDKLLIKPSKSNTKAMLKKVRKLIKDNPAISQELLILKLNPIIRGWVNYQRHNVSKATFSYVDYQIFKALWKWCKRRHNKKSKRWIKDKYFRLVGTRKWTFSYETDILKINGGKIIKQLYYAGDNEIVRHTKVKSNANPFSKDWQQYFEERETELMRKSFKGREKLSRIFKEQNGLCYFCNERITIDTSYVLHTENFENYYKRRMLHPICHKQIHLCKNPKSVL